MTATWERWKAQGQPLEVAGLPIATYDLGDPAGRPVTFVHGYPSASVDIDAVVGLLGSGYRMVTLDLPGFGASPAPMGHPQSIHAAADAVERTWADRGVDRDPARRPRLQRVGGPGAAGPAGRGRASPSASPASCG